jgi:hypothetical protein
MEYPSLANRGYGRCHAENRSIRGCEHAFRMLARRVQTVAAALRRKRGRRGGDAGAAEQLRQQPAVSERRMPSYKTVARFKVPLGGQEIELQEVVHEAGGMPLLRVRIRERTRFTIFELDPVTARTWGDAMRCWGEGELAKGPDVPEDDRPR